MPPVVVSSRRNKKAVITTSRLGMSRTSTSHACQRRRAASAKIGTTVGPTKRTSQQRAAALSPEAHQLARFLKQLKNRDAADVVVEQAVAAAAATTHGTMSSSSSFGMWNKGHHGLTSLSPPSSSSSSMDAARELAYRVQCAWEEHDASTQFQNRRNLPRSRHSKQKRQMQPQSHHHFHETDTSDDDLLNSRNTSCFPGSSSASSSLLPTTTRTTGTAAAIATPLISSSSDSEDCGWMEEEYDYDDDHSATDLVVPRNDDLVAQQEMARTEFWQAVLAHVQLYVRAMTQPPQQSSVIYQVFALSGPTFRATRDDLIPIQDAIQRELWSHYDNGGSATSGRPGGARLTACRVHAVLEDEDARLWMQVNLGHQTASTSTNRPLQFTVVVQPETNFVAVSGSRSRWTPCVLAALEAALTCGRGRRTYITAGGSSGGTEWTVAQRMDHCKGHDPCLLLQAAARGGPGSVVDRTVAEDPVTALHRAATGSLYHHQEPAERHRRTRAAAVAAVTPHVRNLALPRDREPPNRRSGSGQRSWTDQEWSPPVRNGVRGDWKSSLTATTMGEERDHDEEDASLQT